MNKVQEMPPTEEVGKKQYFEYKLSLIVKTVELYLKRMDIWEEWFFKVKYGCITIVVILLGFRYTYAKTEIFLNLIALATTVGLWVFEAVLRTTFFRYMVRLDIMAYVLNNSALMVDAFKNRQLDAIAVLDFNIGTKRLRQLVDKALKRESREEEKISVIKRVLQLIKRVLQYVTIKFKNVIIVLANIFRKHKKPMIKEPKKEKDMFEQKEKMTTIWYSMNLNNVRFFYGTLIILQLMAILFFTR